MRLQFALHKMSDHLAFITLVCIRCPISQKSANGNGQQAILHICMHAYRGREADRAGRKVLAAVSVVFSLFEKKSPLFLQLLVLYIAFEVAVGWSHTQYYPEREAFLFRVQSVQSTTGIVHLIFGKNYRFGLAGATNRRWNELASRIPQYYEQRPCTTTYHLHLSAVSGTGPRAEFQHITFSQNFAQHRFFLFHHT